MLFSRQSFGVHFVMWNGPDPRVLSGVQFEPCLNHDSALKPTNKYRSFSDGSLRNAHHMTIPHYEPLNPHSFSSTKFILTNHTTTALRMELI